MNTWLVNSHQYGPSRYGQPSIDVAILKLHYNEIQEPRRKNVLINYERLVGLFGAGSYDKLRKSHEG